VGGTPRFCRPMDPCTPSVNAILSVALEYGNEERLSSFAAPANYEGNLIMSEFFEKNE